MAKVREGAVLGGMSGRAGNAVFVQTPHGTILRDRPFVVDPRTPAQEASRARLAAVGRVWRGLSVAQARAWREYAARQTGSPTAGQLVFNRLGVKFLQANPGAALPLDPPATAFPGDAVRFVVSGGAGAVSLTADRANAPGVVTEVLLQPLRSVHCRTYRERYRTAAFHAFSAGTPAAFAAAPGVVAVATRFVDAATGQATDPIEWGVVLVG